jgi:hypothetical protein
VGSRGLINDPMLAFTYEEAALLLKELNGIIDGDRFSPVTARQELENNSRQDQAWEPLPPPPKKYGPLRARGGPEGAETDWRRLPTCSAFGRGSMP